MLSLKLATQVNLIATQNKICVATYAKNCYVFFEPYSVGGACNSSTAGVICYFEVLTYKMSHCLALNP